MSPEGSGSSGVGFAYLLPSLGPQNPPNLLAAPPFSALTKDGLLRGATGQGYWGDSMGLKAFSQIFINV